MSGQFAAGENSRSTRDCKPSETATGAAVFGKGNFSVEIGNQIAMTQMADGETFADCARVAVRPCISGPVLDRAAGSRLNSMAL